MHNHVRHSDTSSQCGRIFDQIPTSQIQLFLFASVTWLSDKIPESHRPDSFPSSVYMACSDLRVSLVVGQLLFVVQ